MDNPKNVTHENNREASVNQITDMLMSIDKVRSWILQNIDDLRKGNVELLEVLENMPKDEQVDNAQVDNEQVYNEQVDNEPVDNEQVDNEPVFHEYDADNLSIFNCSTVPACSEKGEAITKKPSLQNNPSNGSNIFSCFHCGLSTHVLKYLKNHIKLEHTKTMLKQIRRKINNTFKKSFKSKNVIIINKKNASHKSKNISGNCEYTMTKKKSYKCQYCTYCTSNLSILKVHQNAIHLGVKKYECSECTYRSARPFALKRHILAMHNKPFVKCGYCNYISENKENIIEHRKSVHEKKSCDKCNYTACKRKTIEEHILAKHLLMKPFKCDECHYNTVRARDLELHKLSKHSRIRPFPCEECDFSAVTRRNLQLHVLFKHLKRKPFKCPECSYSSTTLGNLKRHQLAKH